MRPLLLALALCATPAFAETPMTGDEFESHVGTHMLTYDYGDGLLGIEEYLPGRKVRWAFQADICMDGIWYSQDDQICFVYDNDPTPQCWQFFAEVGGMRGVYMGEGGGWEIHQIDQTDGPLPCAGPEVGV